MLARRTLCVLFAPLLAKEQEFGFRESGCTTVDLMAEFNQWKALP